MADFIVNLKQINGASNDTLIIKKVKSAVEVQNVTTANVAQTVQYASEADRISNKTIEQRLTALGY